MNKYVIYADKVICEKQQIPVVWSGDVIVAGGGPGGLGAAIAAHREGAKTILIEKNGFLGGMCSYGCGMPLGGAYPGLRTIGGIAEEILTLIRNSGPDAADVRHIPLFGDWYFHDSEYFKCLIAKFVLKEKLNVLLHSFVSDIIMADDKKAAGIIIESKSGRQAIIGKTIVDATGDADLCARAGASYDKGDENGDMMGVTIPYIIADVDVDKYLAFLKEDPGFGKTIAKAQSEGHPISSEDKMTSTHKGMRPNTVFVNSVRIRNVDGTKVEDLTRGELEARVRMLDQLDFFRKYVPGFEKAYIASSGSELGVRDTRRIVGEDYLDKDDCINLRKRPESVILRCQGPFDNTSRGRSTSWSLNEIDITQYYDIPYGCLVPKGLDNIIVAGRTFSSHYLAQAGSRGQALLIGMGQASGTAAAMVACDGIPFRDINVGELQRKLMDAGCDLGLQN